MLTPRIKINEESIETYHSDKRNVRAINFNQRALHVAIFRHAHTFEGNNEKKRDRDTNKACIGFDGGAITMMRDYFRN